MHALRTGTNLQDIVGRGPGGSPGQSGGEAEVADRLTMAAFSVTGTRRARATCFLGEVIRIGSPTPTPRADTAAGTLEPRFRPLSLRRDHLRAGHHRQSSLLPTVVEVLSIQQCSELDPLNDRRRLILHAFPSRLSPNRTPRGPHLCRSNTQCKIHTTALSTLCGGEPTASFGKRVKVTELQDGGDRVGLRRSMTTLRGISARRVTDRLEIAELVTEHEPRSIHLSSALHEGGLDRRHRMWILENEQAEVRGLVSVSQWVRDRWQAAPLILDPEAGPMAASLIDRSPAWAVLGAVEDTQHVFPHLARRVDRAPRLMAFFSGAAPIPEFDYDNPQVRQANESDLSDLYALYEAFEADAIPTRPRMRKYVRQCLARGPLLVATIDGTVIAAVRVDSRSRNYLMWGGLTVEPSFRSEGVALSLVMTAICESRDLKMGACMIRGTTNPMSYRQLEPGIAMGALEADFWTEIALRPPLRFRGHGRARRLVETIEGRARRRRPQFDQGVTI